MTKAMINAKAKRIEKALHELNGALSDAGPGIPRRQIALQITRAFDQTEGRTDFVRATLKRIANHYELEALL